MGARPEKVYKVVEGGRDGLVTPYRGAAVAVGARQERGEPGQIRAISEAVYPTGIHCYTSWDAAAEAVRYCEAAVVLSSSNFGTILAEGVEGMGRVVVLDWVVWESAHDPMGDR
jgi:hypothetical protein